MCNSPELHKTSPRIISDRHVKVVHVCIKIREAFGTESMLSEARGGRFTCIVPETTPVRKSPVLVVVILQGHFVLLLEAGIGEESI